MAYYREHVEPRLMNRACGAKGFAPWRQMVCEGLSGTVVEIGFGSGHNVPFYPTKIDVVYYVEPSALALRLAAKRVKSAFVAVEQVGGDAQAIPLADETCDTALSSFTLCTVDDAELRTSRTLASAQARRSVSLLRTRTRADARARDDPTTAQPDREATRGGVSSHASPARTRARRRLRVALE